MLPCIGAHGEMYVRLRRATLVEGLFDPSTCAALSDAVHHHNKILDESISDFKRSIVTELRTLHPEGTIVEAGSSGRRTPVFPLSDIDIVCLLPSMQHSLEDDLRDLKRSLDTQLRSHHPDWKTQMRKFAVYVTASVDNAILGHVQLSADVLFGLKDDPQVVGAHSASQAPNRQAALQDLPDAAIAASQILRVILKSVVWPGVTSRPPSYLADVIIKYLAHHCSPKACTTMPKDPRPYITTSAECFMIWRPAALASSHHRCANCGLTLQGSFWQCLRCDVVCCTRFNKACQLALSVKRQNSKFILEQAWPFPSVSYQTFRAVPIDRYHEVHNCHWIPPSRQWLLPVLPSADAGLGWDLQRLLHAFFFVGAHFDRVAIIFDESVHALQLSAESMPYVQDPGALQSNIVDRFDFKPFLHWCWNMIDDSTRGFTPVHEFLDFRRDVFDPFRGVLVAGSLITVYLYLPDYENVYCCQVDPRWHYRRLLQMQGHHLGNDPWGSCVLFEDHRRAALVDGMGLVPNFDVPMLSRGVTLGSWILMTHAECVKGPTKSFAKPQEIPNVLEACWQDLDSRPRQPRLCWVTPPEPHNQSFLDCANGCQCFFSASLNQVRELGPDFDFRPENEKFASQTWRGDDPDCATRLCDMLPDPEVRERMSIHEPTGRVQSMFVGGRMPI
jgi:hypothetical protein